MKIRLPDGTFAPRLAECHPDKRHKGNGLCETCYSRERARRNQPANSARWRRWYDANREHVNASARRWARENRGKHRNLVLKYRYGLTAEDETQMLEAQDYLCPVCARPFDGSKRATTIAVDHDHDSGVVRGLLHVRCNAGLGLLHDSADNLRRALAYLEAR